jgi:Recombination endonuclease VII
MAIKAPLGRAKENTEWGKFRLHGLTSQQAAEFKAGKPCAICGQVKPRMVVDHDHKTGKLRGVLCNACNWGIGHFRDNPDILRNAADYVEQHRHTSK